MVIPQSRLGRHLRARCDGCQFGGIGAEHAQVEAKGSPRARPGGIVAGRHRAAHPDRHHGRRQVLRRWCVQGVAGAVCHLGGNVYEAERTGVSQGLFTVGEAVKAGNDWFAEGKWQPAGSAPAKLRHEDSKPKMGDEDEGPPRLRRPSAEKSAPPASAPGDTQPSESKTPSSANPGAQTSPKPTPPTEDTASGEPVPDKIINPGNTSSNDEDPNRPVLSRGKTRPPGGAEKASAPAAGPGTKATAERAGTKSANDKDDKKAQTQ